MAAFQSRACCQRGCLWETGGEERDGERGSARIGCLWREREMERERSARIGCLCRREKSDIQVIIEIIEARH